MKKLLALLLALSMTLALAACGTAGDAPATNQGGQTTSDAASAENPAGTSNDANNVTQNNTVPDSGKPVYGGSATVLYGDELLQYFDPAMGDNRTYALWLESLWAIDWGANEPENYQSMYVNYKYMDGQIADTWEPDYDANTLTVTIREDVYFQDKSVAGLDEYDIFGGRQLVAEDVAYSYRRLLGIDGVEATGNTEMPWSMLLPAINTIEVIDDYTLVFRFEDFSEVILDAFITTTANITGAEWDELTAEQQNDWHYAVGTGPYILTGFELDSSMTYAKSENYYDHDERYPENKLPYLDEIKMVQISDSSNILTQFISGQLDIISFGSDVLNSSEIQQLADSMGEGNYTQINYYSTPIGFSLHSSVAPLDDIKVRTALQMAIDTKTITAALYGDAEYVQPGFWAEDLGWIYEMDEETAATYEYNPERAKELLAEAGYPDGFDLTIYIRNDTTIITMMQMAAQYLSQVGVNATLETCADTTQLNTYATNPDLMCGFYSGVGGQYSVKFAQMGFFPTGPAYGLFHGNEEWSALGTAVAVASTLEEQAEVGIALDKLWRENHWSIYGTGCIVLHQFYSAKIGGVTGEQLCCNNNTRTMVARLWSVTGE